MAGRRDGGGGGCGAALLIMSLVCVIPSAYPRPNPAFILPHQARDIITTTPSPDGWSLKDTLARLDDLLQRHNDYNDVMLESGEEDDQLSRLLFNLQHGDRKREGWYDDEPPTLPPRPDKGRGKDTTTTRKARRNRRQNRRGGRRRGRKESRGKSWKRRYG